jgi:adenylate cyclase
MAEPASEELVAFLRSLGATTGQIENAQRENSLNQLPTDLIFAADARLSAAELASLLGVEVSLIVAMWRTLGIAVPDEDHAMFSERDVRFTTLALEFRPVGHYAEELFRVLGSSLTRVAEAAVSLYVQTIEPEMDSPHVDVVASLKDLVETTSLAVQLGDSMGAIFAHHLHDAIDRQRSAQDGVSERSLFRLTVGFVDLVGFTPISLHATPSALLSLIGGFEARAFEVAASHNGRIVKHIGDEVMFVALDVSAGCAIARDLTRAYSDGVEPRGGVAFGEVITRHGDYYGPVVNLASRLADLAIPREVLVDAVTASAGSGSFAFRTAGHRLLKGFDEPVEVFSLA